MPPPPKGRLSTAGITVEPHICAYLDYESEQVELVHPGTQYQRPCLRLQPQYRSSGNDVRLQVVMFCPYCGADFRKHLLWQIPGRPGQNELLAAAREAGSPPPARGSVRETVVLGEPLDLD